MSNLFYYEPFYLDRLVDGIPSGRGIPTNATAQIQKGIAMKPLKPIMDLHEDNQQNIVTATFEFPGVSKEDVKIDLHGEKLIVSAETKQSEEYAENGYTTRERRFGKYSRTLQLPQGTKEDEVKASMENGILTLTYPKATPELAPKRITIS